MNPHSQPAHGVHADGVAADAAKPACCSGNHASAKPASANPASPSPGPANPDPTRDPVCGMSVDPATTAHHARFEGHDFHFCSAGCRTRFVADPRKYLRPAEHAPSQPAIPGAQYTCPMHPEIIRDAPDSCPICGMALEPVLPSLDEGENPELTDFRHRFWWTLPLSVATMVLAMAGMGPALHALSPGMRTWLELALATPVVLWAGWPFLARWLQSIRNRSPNMWTLIGDVMA